MTTADGEPGCLPQVLYFGSVIKLGGPGQPLFVLFVIVPWIGVMMARYAYGRVMELPPERCRSSLAFLATNKDRRHCNFCS